jgi:hypothetical protein
MSDKKKPITRKFTFSCRNVHGVLVDALTWHVRLVVCVCDILQIFCALSQKTASFAVSRGISKAIAQSDLTRDATNATRLDTTLYNAITESVVGTLALKKANVEKPL